MMDGWEIADQISKNTVKDLNISAHHLIQTNLKNFLMRFDSQIIEQDYMISLYSKNSNSKLIYRIFLNKDNYIKQQNIYQKI